MGKPTITERQVTRLAIRQEWLKAANKRQEKLKKDITDALMDGAELPETGPFTILLSAVGGKDFSWEDAYAELLTKNLRKEGYSEKDARELAETRMKKLREAAPDKKKVTIGEQSYIGGIKLNPRPNENYKKEAGQVREINAA